MKMAVWKFAPAIAAGNTSVLKPSDNAPASTLLLAEIASEFLPEGVFNVVTGDRETGRPMIENPIPQMVSITGSVRAGMEVAKSASAMWSGLPISENASLGEVPKRAGRIDSDALSVAVRP